MMTSGSATSSTAPKTEVSQGPRRGCARPVDRQAGWRLATSQCAPQGHREPVRLLGPFGRVGDCRSLTSGHLSYSGPCPCYSQRPIWAMSLPASRTSTNPEGLRLELCGLGSRVSGPVSWSLMRGVPPTGIHAATLPRTRGTWVAALSRNQSARRTCWVRRAELRLAGTAQIIERVVVTSSLGGDGDLGDADRQAGLDSVGLEGVVQQRRRNLRRSAPQRILEQNGVRTLGLQRLQGAAGRLRTGRRWSTSPVPLVRYVPVPTRNTGLTSRLVSSTFVPARSDSERPEPSCWIWPTT